jgi:glycosyltransferase involved in cell wall biosynthesis
MYSQIGWKGSDISLEAFKLAAEKNPELQLVGFGQSAPLPELPLPEGVIYYQVPPQHTLKDIYASCDAWLFSSRWEGFGLPILEAMACRTPVIGTPVGAAPDLLGDGAGILVNSEDPEDLAGAIERVWGCGHRETGLPLPILDLVTHKLYSQIRRFSSLTISTV